MASTTKGTRPKYHVASISEEERRLVGSGVLLVIESSQNCGGVRRLGSLQDIEGLGGHDMRLVRSEDCQSLGTCLHLQIALLGSGSSSKCWTMRVLDPAKMTVAVDDGRQTSQRDG